MGELFQEGDLTTGKYLNLKHFIDDKFPSLPVEKLNLEKVVTAIELSLDTFGVLGGHPEPYIYDARIDLDKYVIDRLKIDTNRTCKSLKK